MAASTSPEREEIKLKDPPIAALLAWLVPGLGHFYQGRTSKGVLFSVCILGTFMYGCYLGGSPEVGWARVVYFKARSNERGQAQFPYLERLEFICQLGVGLPAAPALLQAVRTEQGKEPLFGGFMAPPREPDPADPRDQFDVTKPPTLHQLKSRLPRYFELGTVFTMVAGLLNILAIFDAFAGPVVLPERHKDSEGHKDSDDQTKESMDETGDAGDE